MHAVFGDRSALAAGVGFGSRCRVRQGLSYERPSSRRSAAVGQGHGPSITSMSSGSTTAAWQAAFCVLVPRSHRCSSDWRAPFKKVLYELLKYPVHRYILACLKMQGQVDRKSTRLNSSHSQI